MADWIHVNAKGEVCEKGPEAVTRYTREHAKALGINVPEAGAKDPPRVKDRPRPDEDPEVWAETVANNTTEAEKGAAVTEAEKDEMTERTAKNKNAGEEDAKAIKAAPADKALRAKADK